MAMMFFADKLWEPNIKFEIHIFLKKKTFNVRVTGWDGRVHI